MIQTPSGILFDTIEKYCNINSVRHDSALREAVLPEQSVGGIITLILYAKFSQFHITREGGNTQGT